MQKIKKVLEQNKYDKDQDFSLSSFAEKLGVPKYRISQALNAFSDKSFSTLINEFRIEEAKQKLSSDATSHLKLEAIGEEAFTPPSTTESIAFAWLEEKHYGDLLLQLGARIEHVEITSDAYSMDAHDDHEDEHDDHDVDHDEHDGAIVFKDQSFTPISLSAGAVWQYKKGYNIGLSAAMSQRAPSAAEIFSNGPHIGTNTYEVGALYEVHLEDEEVHFELGDQDVDKETEKARLHE